MGRLGLMSCLALAVLGAGYRLHAQEARNAPPANDAVHPPTCPLHRPQAPPRQRQPASFPDLFNQMAQRFAQNPATAFPDLVQNFSRMDGAALDNVRLSRDEERRIGRQARDEFLSRAAAKGYPASKDRARLAYLQELVDGLASRMIHRDRYPKIEVSLIDCPIADAQSFAGGFLVFTTGLLNEPDEATVAAVVAHELAHLDLGHSYDYARRAKLMDTAFVPSPNMQFDQFFTKQMAVFGLMMAPYRPEHEHEADCRATTWLYLDGYDPQALADFLDRMSRRLRDGGAANPFTDLFRSHPASAERRTHVAKRLAQLQRWHARKDLARYPDNLKKGVTHYADRAAEAKAAAPAAAPP